MKLPLRILAAVCSVALIAALPAAAQKKSDDRARGLFVSKKADAMRIVILKVEDNKLVPVDPSREFKAGDQIKVAFQSNFDGYVYIVNVSPGGKKCLLFPSGDTSNAVISNKRYELPFNQNVIEFDAEKGTEVLQVVMTRERIPYLDAALKDAEGCLGDTASSAAAELAQGGIVTKDVTEVIPRTGPSGIRARDIILAPGRDKDPEGSVVAIPETQGSNGKLKAGEVVTFDIRLKHN
jgi:hypothetical protein